MPRPCDDRNGGHRSDRRHSLADLKGKTIAVNILNSVGAGLVQMIGG